ncbi:MAG: type VI secretion system ImpA family N-terminal domain-containing protein, partial [Sandarakinorhabdus sp.]|nr:type VI secretion system ImpA family N-terminal domain-containing protein [Sandarakinorhabdus sp.]
MLDVESLKAPLGDPAVGPDMRGDVEFSEIEDAPRGFGAMNPGELKKVITRCAALFATTKDQALAIVALEAAARLGDLAEMRAATALIEHLIADHWDDYHPGPADEMGEARINELGALKRRAALLLPLSKLALAKLPGPGDLGFTIGMVKVATVPVAAWSEEDETKLGEMVEKGNATKIDADIQRLQRERGRMLRGIARAVSPDARIIDANANVSFEDMADIPDAENIARIIIAQISDAAAP